MRRKRVKGVYFSKSDIVLTFEKHPSYRVAGYDSGLKYEMEETFTVYPNICVYSDPSGTVRTFGNSYRIEYPDKYKTEEMGYDIIAQVSGTSSIIMSSILSSGGI